MAVVAPIKVGADTDKLIGHAAHFLNLSKKDVVDVAVHEYVHNHRAEIERGVSAALAELDGSSVSAVSMLTGLSVEDLDRLGGIDETR
jgi:hypothetical protein